MIARLHRRLKLALVACSLLASTAAHAQQPEVTHVLSFPRLNEQYISVRSTFPGEGTVLEVKMASWTPGSYRIRDFASNLDRIAFFGSAGQALNFRKTSKNTWTVHAADDGPVVAEYEVHAGELSVRTSWASKDYILVNGASVFLYTDGSRELPQRTRVNVPSGLGHAMSAMPQKDSPDFVAGNFDELVDSPIVVSDYTVRSFKLADSEIRLVNIGAGPLWDGDRAARDLRGIAQATVALWGDVPFERPYWFFNFLVEAGGGLEHDYSTVIMGSRWQMRDREDYIKWMGLAAHEFFHAWNGRRMRPDALASYDLEREQYVRSLWLVEGLTSYYDNLLLSRALLVTPQEYFKRLAEDLHKLEMTPGRSLISLRDASFEAWIRLYQPNANTPNSNISYYTKGAVLGLVLDTLIRRETKSRHSLDDVMRAMYRDWADRAYPEYAFGQTVEAIAGAAARSWVERHLDTPEALDIDEALAWYGLLLNRHPANTTAREKGEALESGIGVTWKEDSPDLVIETVMHGSAGAHAGLLPEDELLAIGGERVKQDDIADRFKRLQPGEAVELLISRRGRILTVPVELEEGRPKEYEIMVNPEFGEIELERLESWLGQPLEVSLD